MRIVIPEHRTHDPKTELLRDPESTPVFCPLTFKSGHGGKRCIGPDCAAWGVVVDYPDLGVCGMMPGSR
jgi:hypothetical protein